VRVSHGFIKLEKNETKIRFIQLKLIQFGAILKSAAGSMKAT
jgi:hypothetical protein